MSAVDALLDALPPATLIVGKGGVGKTTCASALALCCAERGTPTLLITTDPARALPDVLGEPVGPVATRLSYAPQLEARVLDATVLREDFLGRWSGVLRQILDRGTYLDESDIAPLVDTALPGGDEIFAALELARILSDDDAPAGRRIFIDTAPTGHTLRLLELPRTFRALVRLLDSMQEKHRFMVRALTRAYRSDAADAFLAEMSALVQRLDEALRDPAACAALLVANPQPLVIAETRRYAAALRELRIAVAGIVWNGAERGPPSPPDQPDDVAAYVVPRLPEWPTGADGLRRWAAALSDAGRSSTDSGKRKSQTGNGKGAALRRTAEHATADFGALLRPLTVVAGKGGVGKTSVACALALNANGGRATLVVSSDPAPSLADAFEQTIADADTPVMDADGLCARQMDATAAFARMRDEYAARVDALFDAITGRGLDLAADRAIVRDLLALAPPGVDEIYALSLVADALADKRFATVIVDPAPTGHLLRMLDMPVLALEWTHQLMRLMLKYKDVAGLGETARELLEFSRRLRVLEGLLRDGGRCGVVLVTLDEPVVRSETARLAAEVRGRGVIVTGVVLNRASGDVPALPVPDAPVHLQAPVASPAPVGVEALRRWASTWRRVTSHRAP